jgi:hypothetical protein
VAQFGESNRETLQRETRALARMASGRRRASEGTRAPRRRKNRSARRYNPKPDWQRWRTLARAGAPAGEDESENRNENRESTRRRRFGRKPNCRLRRTAGDGRRNQARSQMQNQTAASAKRTRIEQRCGDLAHRQRMKPGRRGAIPSVRRRRILARGGAPAGKNKRGEFEQVAARLREPGA